MLNRLMYFAATAALATATLVGGTSTPASACGGFFCNAQTQTPVYQEGERVLFAQYDALVTMHIEVVYGGEDPSKFAWLLPVPDVPKGVDGQPLPLNKAVSVSLPELFDRLQTMTNPTFTVNRTADASFDGCMRDMAFPTSGGWADASSSADSGSSPGGSPPEVAVLEEAQVGPYDAQLIEAQSSDALFTWLNDNGYYQDPAAKSLLGYYVSLGYKFIGIRLQGDKQTDDLKPLALRLGENAPCVPLRLTSIAAAADMPIMVWVAGNGRAVPKNFIHAEVNPMAINMPSASNYVQVVTEAIDMAAGRAWVTEFSGSTEPFRMMFSASPNLETTVQGATTLSELLNGVFGALSSYSQFTDLLREEIPKPEGLRGYPYDDCFYAGGGWGWGWDAGGSGPSEWCDPNEEHVTSDAEFYTYLQWWVFSADPNVAIVATDLERLKARIVAEVLEPVQGINEVFERTTTLTRFFTTIDPENMTKDPIFAFNPDLPPVERNHTVNTVVYGSGRETCGPGAVTATYDDGSAYSWSCSGFGCWGQALSVDAVAGVSPLKSLQVLDESGEPVTFDPAQAEEVDTYLDNAAIGEPSLTNQEKESLNPPPPVNLPPGATPPGVEVPNPMINTGDGESGVGGCEAGGGAPLMGFVLLFAAGLLVMRRRELRG